MATVIELTDDQKIRILETAREMLGPNGENWTKSCWWGVKVPEDELLARLERFGYYYEDDELPSPDRLDEIDEEEGHEVKRRPLDTVEADAANVWCLMGALEEAAFRLGIVEKRVADDRLADPISLQKLVNDNEEWQGWSVIDVNDKAETTFATVSGLIDERLAQLRASQS